jgi:hypothetical protein
MDGDLGQWTTEPPELKTMIDQVKRNPNPEPYMRDVLTHVAHVGMGGKPRTINVTTRTDGYDLSITYT